MVVVLEEGLELDPERYELRRDGAVVSLEPQTFDVLAYLVENRHRLVTKEELMDRVWGGRFVTEAAVTGRIKQARRAIGDDGQSQRMIRTVHGRGYHFVASAEVAERPPVKPTYDEATAPVRYTVSDGLHIAYQVTGSGSPDIVLISGFVSHLEIDWGDRRHAHFLERLGSMGRLIRFDKRGTGMSDRPQGMPDLETRIHDVLAVMDAVGAEQPVLFGYSEGGAMATLMAATHPERVRALVLFGSYAKRTRAEDYPWAQTEQQRQDYTEELVTRWDWEADIVRRCPSAADAEMQRWWSLRMRAAATPSTIRALMDMNAMVDVRSALPAIRVPTLVLHRTGDALFKVEEAKYLADHIPGATLQLLDGEDHFVAGDPDQILDPIEAFLTSGMGRAPAPAALAAVVAASGPQSEVLHEAWVAAGGRLCRTTSGRQVVLFAGPATAVRAALVQPLGRSRIGVALAEVHPDARLVKGNGVDVACGLADAAAPGEIWLSSVTRDLLAGSGVATAPAGSVLVDGYGEIEACRAVARS